MPAVAQDSRWYEKTNPDDVAGALRTVVRHVVDEQGWRTDADEYHAELYCGVNGAAGVKSRSRRDYAYQPATLPYNIVRSAIDTLVAKIAKHRPLPNVLASRGDWMGQKKAKKMTQLLEGEFYRHKIFEQLGKIIVRDAAIFGRGIVRIDTDGDKLVVERVHPWERYFDEYDARYGDPRNMYLLRTFDKGVLLKRYGMTEKGNVKAKVKEAIECAKAFTTNDQANWSTDLSRTVDRVEVCEAWHLCDRHDDEEEHDCTGRHVVSIGDFILLDEEWPYDFFPFASLNYSDPITGYDGMGIAEILEGYQYEINQMSEKVAEAHHLMGMSLITAPDSAGISNQQVVNGIGKFVFHRNGGEMKVWSPPPVHPQTYQRLRDLPKDAIADAGISLLSATSQKPAGVESGIALQTLDDVETERFIIFGRAYEAFCLDVARLILRWVKVIAEEYGDYAIKVPLKSGILELSWKDIVVDGYVLKVFPTSLLPQQLGARVEKLKYLYVDVGLIDRATFLRQLDAPDLQAELDMETADKMRVDETLEAMAEADPDKFDNPDDGAYFPPDPFIDFAWSARRCTQAINKGVLEGMPAFNQKLLRRFLKDTETLYLKKQNGEILFSGNPVGNINGAAGPPGAAPAPGMPGMSPGAGAEPPPPPPIAPGPMGPAMPAAA